MTKRFGVCRVPELQPWMDLVANIPNVTGLYCVWSGQRVLYIGTSMFTNCRLRNHNKTRKFIEMGADSVTLVKLRPSNPHRRTMEKWLIRKHCPPLNGLKKKASNG